MFFSFNLLTVAISSKYKCVFSIRTFIPILSFVGRYHTSCLSTDTRFFHFPVILVAQVLVRAMGNPPPIWVNGVGDIWSVILSWWILYICVWAPGFCTSTQGLHSFMDSLSGLVSSLFSHRGPSLRIPAHSSSRRVQSGSEEGRVNEWHMDRVNEWHMDWITQWIRRYSCSACLGSLHVSLWWFVTIRNLAAFPNADIHVWFPSQCHPSRWYVLHLDTWGPLFTIS